MYSFKLEERLKNLAGTDFKLVHLNPRKAKYLRMADKMPATKVLEKVEEYEELYNAGYMTQNRENSFFKEMSEEFGVTPKQAIKRFKSIKRVSRILGPEVF